MLITKKSILSGIERTLDIPVTQEELDKWNSGMLIQEAMPNLSPDQREFILTGIVSDEWDSTFEEDENE
jgi:hypothetical protein